MSNFFPPILQEQSSKSVTQSLQSFNIGEAYELIEGKIVEWLKTAVAMLPNFILAVLLIIAFALLAKLLRNLTGKLLHRISHHSAITALISTVVYVTTLLVGVFIALGVLDLDKTVTSLLAGAGIIGLALGFAFQDIAANFMSGIIIAIRRPFRISDVIESNDRFGTVEAMNLRTTVLKSPQGQYILIPNKEVLGNSIINYSRLGKRRIDLAVGVSYGEDLEKVKQVTINAIKSLKNIEQEPDVQVMYTGFGDSSIDFDVQYWIVFTKQKEYRQALSDGIMAIKKAYDENDIMIPFPIRTLDFGIKGGEKLSEAIKGKNK